MVEDTVEENHVEDAPLESGNNKRRLQMDRNKNIVLVEKDGTEKPMTIRDVAFTFGSDVVMRLTQGIQIVGADISTVELD